MPKFKNLMKSIFDEDVNLSETEDTVEPEKEEEVVEKEPEIVKPEEIPAPTPEPTPQPVTDPISLSDVVLDPVPEKKATSFGALDVEKVQKKETGPNYKKPYHFDRSKLKNDPKPVVKKKVEVNYQSVMSPIFGNTSDDQKEYDKVHNAVELEKPLVANSLEQVISPMYGANIPSYRDDNKIPRKDPDATQKVQDESEAISLDEILEKPEKEQQPKQEKLFASKN